MKSARTLDIATIRTLIALQQNEEKKLHVILTNTASSQVRLSALFDLDRVRRKIKTQSDELAKLEAEL
jgi:hypothetical protein